MKRLALAAALLGIAVGGPEAQSPPRKKHCIIKQVVVSMPIGGNCAQLDNWLYVCYVEECR